MCGIFAYTGKQNAQEILLDGLTSLEYRGYDSVGIFVSGAGAVKAEVCIIKVFHAKTQSKFQKTR